MYIFQNYHPEKTIVDRRDERLSDVIGHGSVFAQLVDFCLGCAHRRIHFFLNHLRAALDHLSGACVVTIPAEQAEEDTSGRRNKKWLALFQLLPANNTRGA